MTPYPQCPLFNDQCRFCSHETLVIPFAPLLPDPRTGRLLAGSVQHRKEFLGEYCNQMGWVKDLKYCPARWGLTRAPSVGVRADGCGVYKDSQIIPNAFIAVGTGQQCLNI